MTRTVTCTINAYAGEYCSLSPEDFASKDGVDIIPRLSLTDKPYNNKYTLVGVAQVTVELVGPDELIGNKIEALRAEKKQAMADARMQVTRIERQINELLAITMEPQT